LGCGGFGGNITSDNISPKHLLNIKRLAYEIRPLVHQSPAAQTASATMATASPAEPLKLRVDRFLQGRGFAPGAPLAPVQETPKAAAKPVEPVEKPATFVCEDDVRQAIKARRTITISERSIVTPAARDLGESEKVFRMAGVSSFAK
jgi:hypothetical protein